MATTNRDLLKEAIADAKAVKEMAIANAKAALEESFTPFLREKLSAKITEMDDKYELEEEGFGGMDPRKSTSHGNVEEDLYEDDETLDLNGLFNELELNEVEDDSEDDESNGAEEKMDGDEGMSEEPIDPDDLTDAYIMDIVQQVLDKMAADGELQIMGDETEETEETPEIEDEVETEEEINIDELLAEIAAMNDDTDLMGESDYELEEGAWDYLKKLGSAIASSFSKNVQGWDEYQKTPAFAEFAEKYISEDGTIDPAKTTDPVYKKDSGNLGQHYMQWLTKKYGIDPSVARSEANDLISSLGLLVKRGPRKSSASEFTGGGVKEIQAELEEAYATIKTLRSDLNEVNLLNAKLLYTNKIFKAKNLTESQKVNVLSTFDKATTVKEVKLVFETLNEGLKVKNVSPIRENLGSASRNVGTTKTKKPIVESNDMVSRFQKLAGII